MQDSLQFYFDAIEKQRLWFLEQQERIPNIYWTEHPLSGNASSKSAGEWSFGQVIEHLVLVERQLIPAIQAASERKPATNLTEKLKGKFKRRMVKFVLRNGIKVAVPSTRVEPHSEVSAAELERLFTEWTSLRQTLLQRLREKTDISSLFVFEHPVSGPLDIGETMDFLGDHLQYHQKRLTAEYGSVLKA